MKVLIAVVSCHSRPLFSDTIRDTWLPLVPKEVDVKFFLGKGDRIIPKSDEVLLGCGDGYQDLPEKVQHMVKWAYAHEYDYILKCDDDVVLKPVQLLQSGFDLHDFTGCQDPKVVPGEIRTPWGFCYWLSRKAMAIFKDFPLPGREGSTHSYVHNNDEAFVSTVMYINGVFLHDDQRYFLYRGIPKLPLRPLSRHMRRARPPLDNPREGTFAWCIYIDAGLHNLSAEELTTEFKRVFEENK